MDESELDLRDIVEVDEVAGAERANERLRAGWVLLGVFQNARFYEEGYGSSYVVYVLGLPSGQQSQLD